MRNLIIMLFASVFMFACSQETEEAASTESEATNETMEMEATSEAGEESTDSAAADEMHNPEVAPLPDWDSLPPIEERAEENKKPSTPEEMEKTDS